MTSPEGDEAKRSGEPETHSPERKAEFLLSNAIDREDYEDAVAEVRKMGLDPAKILHVKPFE